MLFVRPARLADLDALEQMARAARPVLHSLPPDRRLLEARVALSEDSFRAEVGFPGNECYLFVLEDGASGRLLGTASIVAAAGYDEPFYAFRNDALIHASRQLHVNRKIHALTMSHELTGKSRLAGFYIDPALHGDAAAQLLSRARMMYVASARRRFTDEVFSLLLGVTDETGASPFWEAVGRKFFGRDFTAIELESGGRSRTFIAEVMPAYPLYVPLLPEAAQRVLGEPAPQALLAGEIHLEEGFETDRYVDIFDAGPVLTVAVDRCTSVACGETRTAIVDAAAPAAGAAAPRRTYLVSAAGDEFRCVLADLPASDAPDTSGALGTSGISGTSGALAPLSEAAFAALAARPGQALHCVPLRRDASSLTRSMNDATGVNGLPAGETR